MRYRLLIITPGPKMSVDEAFFQMLGKYADGAILTTSAIPEVLQVKRVATFDFKCLRHLGGKAYSNLKFILFCISTALKMRARGVKFDLVVTYDPIKTGILGVIVAGILGAKFAPEVNGVYTSDAEYMDSNSSGMRTKIKKAAISSIIGWVLKHADGIKLLFDGQIDPFAQKVKGKVIARYPCYVSTSSFRPIKEDKEILFAGFPFKRKGVDILISAFKKVADKHPGWKLKILGWYPDPTQLQAAIAGDPRIHHHPPVFYRDMPIHIGSCAFVVLPSRSEAMGRVLVEAMACAKPRVGSNIDGIPTVIEHGVDGLLVTPESVDELAAALDRLMSDDELRRRLGEAAFKRSQVEFAEDKYFANSMRFYERVLS